MTRTAYILVLAWGVVTACSVRAATYVDSQVVCHVRHGADPDTVAGSVEALIVGEIEATDVYLLGYRHATPVDSIVAILENNPDVIRARPNYIVNINLDQVSQPFVDYHQTSQAFVDGVSPDRYYSQYAEMQMLIDSAHLLRHGEGIVVAVVDGGLDNTHPLFAGRLDSAAYDFVDNDSDPWIFSGLTADHGTFVGGIVVRAAPRARLMVVRCFGSSGIGTSFEIAQGIYFAARHGADVINMSFGMDYPDGTISDAINTAYMEYGSVLTAAAGNSDLDFDRFPGNHPRVINVAAVDSNDIKAEFSNYGFSVDVTAPGVWIYSSLTGGNVWGWWDGTSFAAPFAAGLAALVRSVYPDEGPEFVANHILSTADDIDYLNPGYEYYLGLGRINFLSAVYIPGDANGSGETNLGDVVHLVNYIFRNGSVSIPPEASDANCDGSANVADAVFLVNYIFEGGSAPGCDGEK